MEDDKYIFQLLGNYIEEDPDDMENFYNDAMNLIRGAAADKNIEFDGYFRERWEISADTIFEFDEDYFENEDRRDLYVFLSALVDEEIFGYLHYVWHHVFHEDLKKAIVETKIFELKEKGIIF
ncbi:hypothetical protein [Chryseobacterium vrystaatense]|uniref:Immunity protein 22 n=1 Tax=Chryseobacterium vrystaatense TaxID=307480 RepID=A0ABR4UJ47_9FLAO|nr:hypothetical protein [Chryseobacterium vrystaatense]KFF24776.1 hypothetical protein IW16_17730 [Chryseobacterium vrystaatense]